MVANTAPVMPTSSPAGQATVLSIADAPEPLNAPTNTGYDALPQTNEAANQKGLITGGLMFVTSLLGFGWLTKRRHNN